MLPPTQRHTVIHVHVSRRMHIYILVDSQIQGLVFLRVYSRICPDDGMYVDIRPRTYIGLDVCEYMLIET